MTPPRILLVNASPPWSGIGRYTRELFRALRQASPPFEVALHLQNLPGGFDPDRWTTPSERAAGARVTVQPRPRWAKQRGVGTMYVVNSHWYFPQRTPPGHDLYHFASQVMGASVAHVERAVVTVHDIVAVRLQRNHPALSSWLKRRHFPPLLRARGLVFISEFSRRDFLEHFDYPEERTCVALNGVSPAFAPRERAASRADLGLSPDRPVLLHVGSEERRKNVETLLDALALLVRRYPDILLLRVGGTSSRSRRRIARHRLGGHVRYLDSITDGDLAACYAAADLFTFPSYFEGFGLPVLEAMRAGCPVVAANATSIPEIVGDAGVLVDPMDPSAMAAAVAALLEDPARRAHLAALGVRRAAEFTWERTAAVTATAYLRALA